MHRNSYAGSHAFFLPVSGGMCLKEGLTMLFVQCHILRFTGAAHLVWQLSTDRHEGSINNTIKSAVSMGA